MFSKKYLFLGDEPISHEHLGSYLRGEKAEHANRNAAWSSKTGKGLLFIAKSEAERRYPQDIINLVSSGASMLTYYTRLTHHSLTPLLSKSPARTSSHSESTHTSMFSRLVPTPSETLGSRRSKPPSPRPRPTLRASSRMTSTRRLSLISRSPRQLVARSRQPLAL